MKTIKQTGIQEIINSKEFSDVDFDINSILTSDLTAQEIEDSLSIIHSLYKPLTEFMQKYGKLAEKLENKEKELGKIEEEEEDHFLTIPWCIGVVILCLFALLSEGAQLLVMVSVVAIWTFGGVGWSLYSRQQNKKRKQLLQAEKEKEITPEINSLKKRISKLPAADFLKNSTFGISTLSALIVSKRLISLSSVLQKMLFIANDKESTPSSRLLTMENYLYLLKKREMDEKLLDETKRANELAEERIKAIKDMENAVNLQTEYQIWQDLGSEAGKATVAHRLYKDN